LTNKSTQFGIGFQAEANFHFWGPRLF